MSTTNPPPLFQTPREILRGTVKQLVYTNQETSYTVLRLIDEEENVVTVVGKFLDLQPAEELQLQGNWTENPRYGRQFRCTHYVRSQPSTLKGIERYLGGMIKGIGPHLAKQMVRYFGFDTLRIIEDEPDRLVEVKGIGRSRAVQIREAWSEYKSQQEVMVFLQGYGISLNQAIKIYRHYGEGTIGLLRENPYRLATDIRGIGFRTADEIAQSLGLPPDSPFRARAAVLYYLQRGNEQGHIFLPRQLLLKSIQQDLNIPRERLEEAIEKLDQESEIVLEPLDENETAVFRRLLAACERGSASRVQRLLQRSDPSVQLSFEDVLVRLQRDWNLELAPAQTQAVSMAISSPLSIITGGPGTGKTTIVRAVCELIQAQGKQVLLAAPTGRAAKRMNEATGLPAKTLHRLLDFSPHTYKFQRDAERPLQADMLIVDEASMIDIFLFYALIRAIAGDTQVLFVGDIDQLPSVGPGNVLRDLIQCGMIPVTRLHQIFRQKESGLIVENAHRINRGELPVLPNPPKHQLLDFYFIPKKDPVSAAQIIEELVVRRIPDRFQDFSTDDIQVISPMYRGEVGVQALNTALQKTLREGQVSLTYGEQKLFVGDRVLQTRNDYDKDVFNGDIGCIEEIHKEDWKVVVRFDGRLVSYDRTDVDDLTLAYAISVHKSQGSEYPVVVIPVLSQHFMMLQRNLLYTAITRGKRLVVLVGAKRALGMAVNNNQIAQRFTRLAWRLQESFSTMAAPRERYQTHV